MTKTYITTILFFINLFQISAQTSELYFKDSEVKEGTKIKDYIKTENCIIIAGKSFDNYPDQPIIAKIDTNGNTIWNTSIRDTTKYNDINTYGYINDSYAFKIIKDSNYIYAIIILNDLPIYTNEIWKINNFDGNIIWKKTFYANYNPPSHFLNYNDSLMLIGYYESAGHAKLAFLNKNNGDTTSTHTIGHGSYSPYVLKPDNTLNNIYYSYTDTVYKVKASNLDSIIWKRSFHDSLDLINYINIHIDSNDSIYLFGRYNNFSTSTGKGKIISLNTLTGNIHWETNLTPEDIQDVIFEENNGFIYSSWRHAYTGSGPKDLWTSKVNKVNGNIIWNIDYSFNGLGISSQSLVEQEGAMSLDFDNQNHLYLTGYYSAHNYGPGNWGILKLNKNDGSSVYERTITEDSLNLDKLSNGLVACVFNNTPCFLGEIETYNNHQIFNNRRKSKACFLKLNPNTGDAVIRKYIAGLYKYPSKLIEIINHNQNTAIFKQVGRYVVVEFYDIQNNLIWTKKLINNHLLKGQKMYFDNNKLTISGVSYDSKRAFPFYSNNSDSVIVYQLDTIGNTIFQHSFNISVSDLEINDIIFDEDSSFLLYEYSNNFYVRKYDSLSISSQTYVNVKSPYRGNSQFINTSDSLIYALGKRNNITEILSFNKNSFITSSLIQIPYVDRINSVKKIKKNLIISGSTPSNHGILISYSTVNNDTNWTKVYLEHSEFFNFSFNSDSSYIYTASSNSYNTMISKIKLSNGNITWSNLLEDSIFQFKHLNDLTYNKLKNEISIVGYQTTNILYDYPNTILIHTCDTNGFLIHSIKKPGTPFEISQALCTETLTNGSTWIGGQIHDSTYNNYGFLFELDSNYIYTEISNSKTQPHIDVKLYPNPSINYLTIEFTPPKNNNKLNISVYDLKGVKVYENILLNQPQGKYQYTINTGNYIGTYILKLTVNDKISLSKFHCLK